MEVCLIEKTKYAGQYPGLFLFTEPARMIRPVTNLRVNKIEYVGSFEQVSHFNYNFDFYAVFTTMP